MTRTIAHFRPISHSLARVFALAALLVIIVLSVGGALAQRMEHHAQQDRFSVGDIAEQG